MQVQQETPIFGGYTVTIMLMVAEYLSYPDLVHFMMVQK